MNTQPLNAPERCCRFLALILLLPLAWCLVSVTAWAESVGVLNVEKGVVKLRRGAQERFIQDKDGLVPVEVGDALHSGSGARGFVYFERENQKVAVYPGSMIQVKAHTEKTASFFMPLGKVLFSVLNKLRPEQRFEVTTPTATIGVKGTEFMVGTDGVSKTFLLTLSGEVSLVNPEFPNMETLVPKDQATVSHRSAPPAPPVVVPPETRNAVIKEDSVKSMEALPVQPQPAGDEKTSSKEEKSKEEKSGNEEQTADTSKEESSDGTTQDSGSTSVTSTTTSTSDATSATASMTSLVEAVSTVQSTTKTVETATATVNATCGGAAGCGRVGFTW